MEETMKVYLCGPINGCTDAEAKDWRQYAKTKLPFTMDPMVRDYRGREDLNVREIVEQDKRDISDCDVLLVKYDKPSVGTSMEIMYAYERSKCIVVVAAETTSISPWLRYHSSKIFHTFDEAFSYLGS